MTTTLAIALFTAGALTALAILLIAEDIRRSRQCRRRDAQRDQHTTTR
jgi:hypothetical protein